MEKIMGAYKFDPQLFKQLKDEDPSKVLYHKKSTPEHFYTNVGIAEKHIKDEIQKFLASFLAKDNPMTHVCAHYKPDDINPKSYTITVEAMYVRK